MSEVAITPIRYRWEVVVSRDLPLSHWSKELFQWLRENIDRNDYTLVDDGAYHVIIHMVREEDATLLRLRWE